MTPTTPIPARRSAALEVLAELPGRRWLVLGDMAELGSYAADSHREMGALARSLGVERLFTFGPLAALAAESFGAGAERYTDIDALVARRRRRAARRSAIAGQGLARQPTRAAGRPRSPARARGAAGGLMLYWAAKHLAVHYSVFNVFSYLTLRSILAAMSAMAIALLVGPFMISRLARYQIGQVVRDDGPQSHLPKAGTPTMGGMLIIFAVVLTTTLWGDLVNRFVLIALGITLGYGLIGFYDDYLKLVVGNSRGLVARWKYFWQSRARASPPASCSTGWRTPPRWRPFTCRSSRAWPGRWARSVSCCSAT